MRLIVIMDQIGPRLLQSVIGTDYANHPLYRGNTRMSSDLRNVAIAAIRENPVALRGVDKEDAQYISLRDSVGKYGVQAPITVREKQAEDGSSVFEIVDGLHRFSASLDTGKTEIPVNVITADEASVLELQVVGNICKVDTAPAQYAQQLKRMFSLNPTMTLTEMAEKVCQSPAWVNQRLSLTKLDGNIQTLVDNGDIGLSNAYALSKLPKEEQANFVDQAMTMQPAEFAPTVQQRAKELKDAARQGREANPQTFQAVAHIRKVGDIKAALDNNTLDAVVAAAGAKTALEGGVAVAKWVMSLDAASVAKQEADYTARVQKKADEKAKNEVARATKKADEAAKAAADVIAKQATAAK